MCVSVLDKKEELHLDFNHHSWSNLLLIAYAYGWQPAGIQLEIESLRFIGPNSSDEELQKQVSEWKGSNSPQGLFQYVTDEDARN